MLMLLIKSHRGDLLLKTELTIPDVLGPVIQRARQNLGITADEMISALGAASAHHYSFIDNGHSKPSYNTLIAIVRYLNIDPNEFFYPEREHLDTKRLQLIHGIETCSDKRIDIMTAVWGALPNDEDADK